MIKPTFLKSSLLLLGIVIALTILTVINSSLSPPEVSSVNPPDQSINVLDPIVLQVVFTKPPTSSKLKSLEPTLSPSTPLSLAWDGPTLTITPLQPLLPLTSYVLTISSRGKPFFSSSFTTNRFSLEELKVQASQQILDDKIQADVEKAYYQANPWLRALPLETSSYRVIYDYETKKLRIRLLNGSSADILPQIIARLKSLSVDANTIGYDLVN